jgi:hypothetical protein
LVLIRPRSPASFFELDWCAIKSAARVCSFAKRRSAAKLIDREVVYKMNEGIFIALRQTVLASGLTDIEKIKMLKEMRRGIQPLPATDNLWRLP